MVGDGIGAWYRVEVVVVRIHNVEGPVQEPGEDVHVRRTPMGAALGVDEC